MAEDHEIDVEDDLLSPVRERARATEANFHQRVEEVSHQIHDEGHVTDVDGILDHLAATDEGGAGHALSEAGYGPGRVVTQTWDAAHPGMVRGHGPAENADGMLHYAAQTDAEIGHRLFNTEYNPFEGAEAPNGMQDVEGAQPVDLTPDYVVGPAPDNPVDDFRPIDIPQGAELVDDLGMGSEPNPFDLAD